MSNSLLVHPQAPKPTVCVKRRRKIEVSARDLRASIPRKEGNGRVRTSEVGRSARVSALLQVLGGVVCMSSGQSRGCRASDGRLPLDSVQATGVVVGVRGDTCSVCESCSAENRREKAEEQHVQEKTEWERGKGGGRLAL